MKQSEVHHIVWWCGGVVVWWCGGVVVWWVSLRFTHPTCT